MSDSKDKKQAEQKPAAVYFKSLTIRDVKCFRGKQTIALEVF